MVADDGSGGTGDPNGLGRHPQNVNAFISLSQCKHTHNTQAFYGPLSGTTRVCLVTQVVLLYNSCTMAL